jgi:hypothetical protein
MGIVIVLGAGASLGVSYERTVKMPRPFRPYAQVPNRSRKRLSQQAGDRHVSGTLRDAAWRSDYLTQSGSPHRCCRMSKPARENCLQTGSIRS